jgi:hypothetical protein
MKTLEERMQPTPWTREQEIAYTNLKIASKEWVEARKKEWLPEHSIKSTERRHYYDVRGRVKHETKVEFNGAWVKLQNAKEVWKEVRPEYLRVRDVYDRPRASDDPNYDPDREKGGWGDSTETTIRPVNEEMTVRHEYVLDKEGSRHEAKN